ncbi:MAG: hydroxyethylthiazole kinase [Xanthobacteraceae bacterium]|jgi:hydroxyethylthiazole kinase
MHAPVELADVAADILARIRARAPRVHCITNTVAQQYTANMLLAAGAVPSMTISPDEIASFVVSADALLVNLGTFDAERRAAVEVAVGAANAAHIPWVLDPVFIDRAPARAQFARELLARGPAVVRLNTSEFVALSGADAAADAPARFAKSHATVVALTGGTDLVTDGARRAVIANGDHLMGMVTAMGCAGSALVCAARAVETDAWLAASTALMAFGVAGEVAAQDARGPGSFATAIIDTLYGLDGATLRTRARVT